MKNNISKVMLVILCFFLMCGFTRKELETKLNLDRKVEIPNTKQEEINEYYLEYEKLSDEEKAKVEVIPSKYVSYTKLEPKKSLKSRKSSSRISGTTPTSYDLRDVNGNDYTPDTDDQGYFGLCWAFALNNTIESNLKRQGLGNYNLSENHLDYVEGRNGAKLAGMGWTRQDVIDDVWFNGFGPVTEDRFGEYDDTFYCDASGRQCTTYEVYDNPNTDQTEGGQQIYLPRNISEYLSSDQIDVDVNDVIMFPAINMKSTVAAYGTYANLKLDLLEFIEPIKQHIMDNGAIMGSFEMDDSYHHVEDNNEYYFSEHDSAFVASSFHSITIIGWNNSKGADVTGDGVPDGAWLIQNSWGNIQKYFYISYFDKSIVQEMIGVSSTSVKNWDNIYYDEAAAKNIYISGSKYVLLNDYKISNNNNNIEDAKVIKVLYYGIDNPVVDLMLGSDSDDRFELDNVRLHRGLNSFNVNDCDIEGTYMYLTIRTSSTYSDDLEYMYANVYSENISNDSKIEITSSNDEDYTLFLSSGQTFNLDVITKNYSSGVNYNIKIFDDNNSNISNKFDISKGTVLNGLASLTIESKSVVSNTDLISICAEINETVVQNSCYVIPVLNLKGLGTSTSPLLIEYPQQLLLLDERSEYFKLENDLDMEAITSPYGMYYNDGKGLDQISFYGVLDGNNKTISNMYSKKGGLFLSLEGDSNSNKYSVVKNLRIDKSNIELSENTYGAILAENCYYCIIENCEVSNSSISGPNESSAFMYDIYDSAIVRNNKITDVEVTGDTGEASLISNIYTDVFDDSIASISVTNNVIDNIEFNKNMNKGSLVNAINYIIYSNINDEDNFRTITINNNYSYTSSTKDVGVLAIYKYDENDEFTSLTEHDNVEITGNVKLTETSKYEQGTYTQLDFESIWIKNLNEVPRLKSFDVPNTASDNSISDTEYYPYNNVLYNVEKNTSLEDFISNIELNLGVTSKVFDRTGKLMTSGKIGTGASLVITNGYESKTFTIIVPGDVNGNGDIDIADIRTMANYIISSDGNTILKTKSQLLAADVNYKDGIDIADIRKLANYTLNESININKSEEAID